MKGENETAIQIHNDIDWFIAKYPKHETSLNKVRSALVSILRVQNINSIYDLQLYEHYVHKDGIQCVFLANKEIQEVKSYWESTYMELERGLSSYACIESIYTRISSSTATDRLNGLALLASTSEVHEEVMQKAQRYLNVARERYENNITQFLALLNFHQQALARLKLTSTVNSDFELMELMYYEGAFILLDEYSFNNTKV